MIETGTPLLCCLFMLPGPIRSLPASAPAGPSDSWAPPEARVAVPFGACLLSFLCFGQTVRLLTWTPGRLSRR